ncbi:MAG: LuxR C-terminal-related transcriptional regulator [Coxiellaceae bacterium]|nr:LuxR C-terminal-related transcriptional regulator [Coxiellaceae bacterium]
MVMTAEDKKQVEQHLSMVDSEDILAICQPMRQHFGMRSLVYKRVFKDGREISLSTHPEWVAYYFENELFRDSALEKEIEHYVEGHLIWSQIPTHSPILKAVAERYDISNGITLIRPDEQGEYCEFYFLGAAKENTSFAQQCTNNMDLLDQFTEHFRYHAGDLIEKLEQQPIHVLDKYERNKVNIIDIPCYQNQSRRHQFMADLNRNGAVVPVGSDMVMLTRRETEVARYVLDGMTMKQIAERCYISPRTVETHIDHLKQKLRVRKKSELLQRLKGAKAFQVLS